MKRALFLAVMFTLLLPQLLFSNQWLNDCCGRWFGPLDFGLVSAGSYIDVNVSQAKQMIDSNPNLVILDVRTQAEYDGGHIQNATLIPVTELAGRLGELNKEGETLVYCGSGGRSATASQILVDNGFPKVYNMLGGITAWRNAGYWTEIIHNGDLIINGTQTFVIENCSYVQTGNIQVKDYGTLIIRNSSFLLNQTSMWQHHVNFADNAKVIIEDTEFVSSWWSTMILQDYTDLTIDGSTMSKFDMCIWANLDLSIFNSTLATDTLRFYGSHGEVRNTTLDFAEIYGPSSVFFSDSVVNKIGLDFTSGPIGNTFRIDSLRPGFFPSWNSYENLFGPSNTTLFTTTVRAWGCYFGDSDKVYVNNSALSLLLTKSPTALIQSSIITELGISYGNPSVEMNSSELCSLNVYLFNGSILFSNVTATPLGWKPVLCVDSSHFYMYGNITKYADYYCPLNKGNPVVNSSVIRNYGVNVQNARGQPVSNASLLIKSADHSFWNGTTDGLGQVDFNLTFSDSNYTSTLRLEAVKENYTGAINLFFLSDTPVVMRMHYFADLNGDGIINILDISIVAKPFYSKLGDTNWNEIADLNTDGVINILDIALVAKDFGKTV